MQSATDSVLKERSKNQGFLPAGDSGCPGSAESSRFSNHILKTLQKRGLPVNFCAI
jgi:hypothetical protein